MAEVAGPQGSGHNDDTDDDAGTDQVVILPFPPRGGPAGAAPWAGRPDAFRAAFEQAPVGMAMGGPDGVVREANAALCRLLGRPLEEVLGRRVTDLAHPDDLAAAHTDRDALEAGRTSDARRRLRIVLPDGSLRWADLAVAVVRDVDGEVRQFVAHVADATEAHHRESELRQHSLVDPLTDLLNRRALAEAGDRLRAAAVRGGDLLAVLFCDLDRFKEVNDTAGHRVGDELLRLVARRIRHVVRPEDLLARLGGDEFALVCRVAEPGDALAFARRVVRCFDEPFRAGEASFRLGVSIGVAVGRPEDDLDRQLAAADAAMYTAKAGGHVVALAADCTAPAAGRASRADAVPVGAADHQDPIPDDEATP